MDVGKGVSCLEEKIEKPNDGQISKMKESVGIAKKTMKGIAIMYNVNCLFCLVYNTIISPKF